MQIVSRAMNIVSQGKASWELKREWLIDTKNSGLVRQWPMLGSSQADS